ncbi:hypothetical protein MJT46_009808 [Ovis ammon polii x Ovis aries]|nr:hypothetical protein MJT46_009808 [Ovis ammon polii x Ovis aries]
MPALETRTDSRGETPKYPKMHVSTEEESSGSGPDSTQGLRPQHRRERNPERPPRNSHGEWPFLRPPERVPEAPSERIPGVPVASQEEALSTGKARGTPGSCHHSKSPPDVSVHSRGTCFPCTALTFKPRIDSHHVSTWDSPVGKPRGKASWERLEGKTRGQTVDPLIHAADCVTLLLPLWRKAQVHARIRDED